MSSKNCARLILPFFLSSNTIKKIPFRVRKKSELHSLLDRVPNNQLRDGIYTIKAKDIKYIKL